MSETTAAPRGDEDFLKEFEAGHAARGQPPRPAAHGVADAAPPRRGRGRRNPHGIRHFAQVERATDLYHETLTLFWIEACRAATPTDHPRAPGPASVSVQAFSTTKQTPGRATRATRLGQVRQTEPFTSTHAVGCCRMLQHHSLRL